MEGDGGEVVEGGGRWREVVMVRDGGRREVGGGGKRWKVMEGGGMWWKVMEGGVAVWVVAARVKVR